MKRIKNDDGVFYPCRVKDYMVYERKLRHILRRNKNQISFIGCIDVDGRVGIVAMGDGIHDITTFNKFYQLKEINKYFYSNLGG
ncbi:MAG: hypothetical protein GY853_16555 [PVC group bacterium]|nr:hypothetical protein [PVC group bacterium]